MQLTQPMRFQPHRSVRARGCVVLALALLTGACDAGTEDSGIPGVPHPVTEPARPGATSAPATPDTPPEEPEPTPSFSQNGKTRVLYYGDAEVDATPADDGVLTTVTVHNDTDKTVNYSVDISVGDGVDWVASSTFRISGVPAHGVKSQTDTVGGTHLGPVPQQPKIYVDRFGTY
ncbi:hypothetical protein [Streptomyces sp. NPDC002599]|uniref:hypothetical protein n=1 Tax=Streptomyces sp. NPDC002599 TaxID=3154421 RepID=UPI00331743C8